MDSPTRKRWHSREESGLRLDRNGRWWHDDQPVEHPRIVEAFNRGLVPSEDGRFRLQFGGDWCFVEVEDAAYGVVQLHPTADDQILLQLTDRTSEALQPDTLRLDPLGVLCCMVKEGLAKARFSKEAQFALGSLLEETHGEVVLVVGQRRIPVPFRIPREEEDGARR